MRRSLFFLLSAVVVLSSHAQDNGQAHNKVQSSAELSEPGHSEFMALETVQSQDILLSGTPAVKDLSAVALSPNATAEEGLSTVDENAWLNANLHGHDNQFAALEFVEITAQEQLYTIYFQSQYGLRCLLDFSADGQPQNLSNCTFNQGLQWVQEDHIELECGFYVGEHVCNGEYTLRSENHGARNMRVAVARRQ